MRAMFLAALLAVTGSSTTGSLLASSLHSLERRPAVARARFGAAIYDMDAHRMLFAQDADKYFLAASTTKLLTEGATLALLGPGRRFVTNVYRTGGGSAAAP